MNYKIGILGYGYWGKILYNNLHLMGHNNITICDPALTENRLSGYGTPIVKNKEDLHHCDKIFIATPTYTHYDLCKYFLHMGYDVFCEKPLCIDSTDVHKLYEIIDEGGGRLFVDWTFLYNDSVWAIKDEINNCGLPNLIYMNRLNYGPCRDDVSAKYDLAAHDLSILLYLLGDSNKLKSVKWNEYKLLSGTQNDSCTGIIDFEYTKVVLNASWAFNSKIRTCYLNFGDSIVVWDDTLKRVTCDDKTMYSTQSPLNNSIQAFLDNGCFAFNRKITEEVSEMLEW